MKRETLEKLREDWEKVPDWLVNAVIGLACFDLAVWMVLYL